MSYSDLLDRMQKKDSEAFLEMTDRYGWSVYSAIREKYSDPAVADKVYNETMNAIYYTLTTSTEDPLEAILCSFADRIDPEKLAFIQPIAKSPDGPPRIRLYTDFHPADHFQATEQKRGIRHILCIFFLLLVLLALLWCISGLLMELKLIPYMNLGYSWFCSCLVRLL